MRFKLIAGALLWGGLLLPAVAESLSFDFESDPRDTAAKYRWQAISNSKDAEETARMCQWSSLTAKNGKHSLMLTSDDFSHRAIWLLKWIPVKSRTIKISGWIKTVELQGGPEKWQQAMVSVFYFKKPDWKSPCSKNSDTVIIQSGDNDWTPFQKILTVPEDAAFLNIQFWLPACKGAAWLDDLTIEEMPDAAVSVKPEARSSENPVTVSPTPPTVAGLNYFAMEADRKKKPVIDGNLEEWNGITPVILNRREQITSRDVEIWSGQNDLSVKFYLTFDPENLYLACQVTDDKFHQTSPWPTEKIQFAFDCAPTIPGHGVRQNYYEISMAIMGDGKPFFNCDISPPGREESFAGARYAIRRDSAKGITNYELAIPWKSLAPFDLSQGKIGFNLIAMDNDGAGVKQWIGWTPGIAGGKDPDKFGRVYFDRSRFSSDVNTAAARKNNTIDLITDKNTFIVGEKIAASALFLDGSAARERKLTQKFMSDHGKTIEKSSWIMGRPGLNRLPVEQDSDTLPPGRYTLTVSLNADAGEPIHSEPRSIELVENRAGIIAMTEQLRRKLVLFQKLSEQAAAKNIPIPYQTVSINIIRYGLDEYLADFADGTGRSKWLWGAGKTISPENVRNQTIMLARNSNYLLHLADKTQSEIEHLLIHPGDAIRIPAFDIHQVEFKNGRIYSNSVPTFVSGMLGWNQVCKDMALFPGFGFNMAAIEGGPNAIVVAENVTSEKRIDEYWLKNLKNAENANLMINLFTSSTNFPSWVRQKYPELFNPEYAFYWDRIPCCIDTPVTRKVFEDFFNTLVPKIKNHPGLMAYELTTEFTGYVCNCPESGKRFIQYLKQRHLQLEVLNRCWNTNYSDWNQIGIPRRKNASWGAWYDWCTFNQQRNIAFWQWQKALVRKHDPTKPVVIGTAYSSGGLVSRYELGVDQEGLACIGEINGSDGDQFFHSENLAWGVESMVFSLDFYRSLTPDSVLMDTEFHPLNTVPFEAHGNPEHIEKGVRMMLWLAFLHGTSAVSTYVWHNYGLDVAHAEQNFAVYPAALNALGRTSLELRRLAPLIVKFFDSKPQVRILYALPSVAQSEHLSQLNCTYESLWFNDAPVGFVTERQIADNHLKNCSLLIAPGARRINDSTYRKIAEYVKDGGTLVITGQDSLRHDEYDRLRTDLFFHATEKIEYAGIPLEKGKYGKGTVFVMPSGSPRKMAVAFNRLMEENGVVRPVRIVDQSGQNICGIESRSVVNDGRIMTYIINLNKENKKVFLQTPLKLKSIRDVISGKKSDVSSFDMAPMQILLLEFNQKE